MHNVLFFAAIACFAYNVNAETANELYDNFKIEINDGVIQESKYANDAKIYELNIPATVKTIEKYAFSGCKNLTSLRIPFSVFEVGEFAFANCRNLTSAVLGQNIYKIPTSMFDGCINLDTLHIPNGIHEIGDAAFFNCQKLDRVFIPDSVEIIGKNAFDECKNLKEISIFANVKIGENAFKDTDIRDVYIRYDSSKTDQYNVAYQTASIIAAQLPESQRSIVKWHYQAVTGALDAKEALKKRRRHSVR